MASTRAARSKKIWKRFTGHHIQHFYGLWTRWNPKTCQILESFRGVRYFRLGDNDEEVIHKNTHYYKNEEPQVFGPWNLSLAGVVDDGLVHPVSISSRGYFFPNGDCVWDNKSLKEGRVFNEIFFCHGHLRTSLVCTYVPAPELLRVVLILEDSYGWDLVEKWAVMNLTMTSYTKVPTDWPSTDLQLKGREKILTADLEDIEGEVVIWKPPEVPAGYHAYCFPNGYMIICPDTLVNDVETEITALEYTNEEGTPVIRQITTFYDIQGQFTRIKEVIFSDGVDCLIALCKLMYSDDHL